MDPGDALATIAESQIGIRSDSWSNQGSMFGYLMATDSSLTAFGTQNRKGAGPALQWDRVGFGSRGLPRAHHFSLLDPPQEPDPQFVLHFHNWCAAFVDWCVMQLLLRRGQTTALSLGKRPKTALAFGLLDWGRNNGCTVFADEPFTPSRGDIAVYKFSHVGIVASSDAKSTQLMSIEGNTTQLGHGNQGYVVAKRARNKTLLKGLVRLPASP
jgi:hypothetical protein